MTGDAREGRSKVSKAQAQASSGGPGEVGPERTLYVILNSCGESPCCPVMRSPGLCSHGHLSVPGKVHLALCLYNVGNSGVERDQNLNAREGAFGRGKFERGQLFRERSVSTVDMQPPSWVHRGTTHTPTSHLQCLATTAHGVGSSGSQRLIEGF